MKISATEPAWKNSIPVNMQQSPNEFYTKPRYDGHMIHQTMKVTTTAQNEMDVSLFWATNNETKTIRFQTNEQPHEYSFT